MRFAFDNNRVEAQPKQHGFLTPTRVKTSEPRVACIRATLGMDLRIGMPHKM